MKILFVTPTLSSNALAASFRVVGIIEAMLVAGLSVIAYTRDSSVSPRLSKYISDKRLQVVVVSDEINFLSKLCRRLFGIPDSDIFWARKVYRSITAMENIKHYHGVFVSSPPHSVQMVGYWLSKNFNIPFFSDFRDDWSGSHRLRHVTYFHKLLSLKLQDSIVNQSTLITHAIPMVADEWSLKYGSKTIIHKHTNGFSGSLMGYLPNENTKRYRKNAIAYFGGGYGGLVVKILNEIHHFLQEYGLGSRWMIVSGGPFDIPDCDPSDWLHHGNVPEPNVFDCMYDAKIQLSILPESDIAPSKMIPLKLYTQLATRSACVYIGNPGAATDLFKSEIGFLSFGHNELRNFVAWVEANESNITAGYDRHNISRFNFSEIADVIVGQVVNVCNEAGCHIK